MNKLGMIFILLMISFFTGIVEAGEVTGAGRQVENILNAHNFTPQRLQQMGLKVKLGEVTGAGKVHVDDLRLLVTKKGVFEVDNLHNIKFRHPSAGKFVAEVKSFDFPGKKVQKSNILAYVIAK